MTRPAIELLVLDAQGVVFNNPFRTFLRELALRTGQLPELVLDRWDRELRLPAWTGDLDDRALWHCLTGGKPAPDDAPDWLTLLESRYALGPAARHLASWRQRVPVWLLSNHRSHWLMPRLKRFGLADSFDRVLVSDALGAAKPAVAAFEPVLSASSSPERVLFLDDQWRNVRSARSLGLTAEQVTSDPAWRTTVEQQLAGLLEAPPLR